MLPMSSSSSSSSSRGPAQLRTRRRGAAAESCAETQREHSNTRKHIQHHNHPLLILQPQNNPRTALNNLRSASARSSYFSSHNKDPSARNSFPSARNKAPSARNNAPSARNNPRLLAIETYAREKKRLLKKLPVFFSNLHRVIAIITECARLLEILHLTAQQ